MKRKKLISFIAIGLSFMLVLSGCSSSKTSGSSTKKDSKVKTIKVAFDQASKPISYIDENGKPTGYDIEAMKLVDELLPDYKFEYIGTTSDDLLLGVEQGKYDVGVKNAFWTPERTKKFIFPKEFIGLSSAGIVLKKKNENIKSLSDFASAGLTLAPIAANNAQYTIIEEYNKANPTNKVKLKAGDSFTIDIVQWVNEGRVDGGIMIEGPFKKQVVDKDGPYHKLANDVVYNEFAVIKTWPLFNKKQQEFANAYDEAVKKLKSEKKLEELSVKFYGRDLFKVLGTVKR